MTEESVLKRKEYGSFAEFTLRVTEGLRMTFNVQGVPERNSTLGNKERCK